jgi:RNA polymerase sigma factor (sigma-70 family)
MVFGVCRRILHHEQDAEDAFQAAFLMLARKAGSIGKRDSVSGWLYTVAYRIALRAKMRSARRGHVEKPLDELPIDAKSGDPADLTAWRELRQMLDAELSQIPEKYRTAFILCHLEGKTCEEAAEQLGCPRGTVQSRVGRARERLRARLTLRGWTATSSTMVHLLEQHAATMSQAVPVLVHSIVPVAMLLALGKSIDGSISTSVFELMSETVSALRWSRLRYLAILAVLALLGTTALVWGAKSAQAEALQDITTSWSSFFKSSAKPCHNLPTMPGQ